MSEATYKAKRKDLDAKLKLIDLWIFEVSQEDESEDKRAAMQGLLAVQKYYSDKRIGLHS